MANIRSSVIAAALVLVGTVLLLGSPLQAQEKVVFASSTGGGIRLATDIIKAKNLDKKNGIDLDLKYFVGPKGIAAVVLGKVDTGYMSPLVAANQLAQDEHIVSFELTMDSHMSLLKQKGSPLKSLADLRGKRLGFTARASSSWWSFRILLAQQGRKPEKDYKVIVGNLFALKAFLLRKDVDAILMFEPFSTKMIVNGEAEQLLWYEDLWSKATNGVPFMFNTVASRKSWLDAHPKAARALARAYREARAWIVANPDEALKIGNKTLKIENPKILEALKRRMLPIYKRQWDQELIDAGNWQVKKAVELGILGKKALSKPLFVKF